MPAVNIWRSTLAILESALSLVFQCFGGMINQRDILGVLHKLRFSCRSGWFKAFCGSYTEEANICYSAVKAQADTLWKDNQFSNRTLVTACNSHSPVYIALLTWSSFHLRSPLISDHCHWDMDREGDLIWVSNWNRAQWWEHPCD